MMNINQTYKVINKSYKIISTDLVVNEIRTLGISGGILAFAGKAFFCRVDPAFLYTECQNNQFFIDFLCLALIVILG